MKAPDKIYISPLMMSMAEILGTKVTPDDVEYIRKDLLLEWAKDNKENTGSLSTAILLQELINKINSL